MQQRNCGRERNGNEKLNKSNENYTPNYHE
jgi:hypothetical protein